MSPLIFAFMTVPGRTEQHAQLLAASIRAFGGSLAANPVWVLVPTTGQSLADHTCQAFDSFGACVKRFPLDRAASGFPFAAKVFASAWAESLAEGRGASLAWLDTDSLVIQAPTQLELAAGKSLAYRPVDHTLIGSPYSEPVDPFWQLIYRRCQVAQNRLFPMETSVDRKVIRPYFNAGLLVVHPERALLRRWRDHFEQLYTAPESARFYAQDPLYRIFIHQAVLAGVVLSTVARHEMEELPYLVNYPLHMHAQYPPERRPHTMNELITCRYDTLAEDPSWWQTIAVAEPLHSWLTEQMGRAQRTRSARG